MRKTLAFTLAETLIVLGIIGVVAALTIPTLNSDTNSKDKITKVKKSYSVLEDAFGRMVSDLGPVNEWSDGNLTSRRLTGKIASYMKTTKKCFETSDVGCFSASALPITTLGEIGKSAITGSEPSFLLADGIAVSLIADTTSGCQKYATFDVAEICGMAIIDVDGPTKGKDQYGLDLFAFYVTPEDLVPVGLDNDNILPSTGSTTKCIGQSDAAQRLGCTAWVIYNGNMDYNKLGSDGKCPDGSTELTWTGTQSCPD